MAKNRVTGFFFRHGPLTKSVENGLTHISMEYYPKQMKRSQENGKKMPKTPNLDTKWPKKG